jgi:hypothetical protein
MNCKPGDLAMIVGGVQENLGRLVRVIGPVDVWGWEVEALQPLTVYTSPPGAAVGILGAGGHAGVSDHILRPLRDQDGDDQTFTWAGKPSHIDSPAEAR